MVMAYPLTGFLMNPNNPKEILVNIWLTFFVNNGESE